MNRMSRKLFSIATGAIFLMSFAFGPDASAAEAPFYDGKTLKILVSSGTGGGTDTAARLVSRFIGKYLPGNPKVARAKHAGRRRYDRQ